MVTMLMGFDFDIGPFRCFLLLSGLSVIYTNAYEFETKFFNAKLDHYNTVSNQTFKLKYLINDTFWDREGGAPIFFYCGNEDAIETFAQNLGFLWESAERFRALVLFVEHRYYGSSLPFGEDSLRSPRTSGFLSIEQTLADFVEVIDAIQEASRLKSEADRAHSTEKGTPSATAQSGQPMKLKIPRFSLAQDRERTKTFSSRGNYEVLREKSARVGDSEDGRPVAKLHPVIAFGGSYGGMLAFWLRLKYPHIVQGALASSAPMFQINNLAPCDTYYKAVSQIYHDVSPGCEQNIRNLWGQINTRLQTDIGRVEFSREWNLCSLIKTQVDVAGFKNWLEDMFTTMAMTNYPYPSDFITPLPGNPIQAFCDAFLSGLSQAESPDLLLALHHGVGRIYPNALQGESCLNIESSMKNILPTWHFQTCTELLFPFCATEDSMYEPYAWNPSAWAEACRAEFGVGPEIGHLRRMFGDRRIEFTSNVIFSNGLKDPWAAGGVLTNLSSSIVSILIPDAAHHLDLRGSDPRDPPGVVAARAAYEEMFQAWIQQFHEDLEREASFIER